MQMSQFICSVQSKNTEGLGVDHKKRQKSHCFGVSAMQEPPTTKMLFSTSYGKIRLNPGMCLKNSIMLHAAVTPECLYA